jgi:hypothetical protein
LHGIASLFLGLVILISLVTFLINAVLVWISFRRTFKTDKAFMISAVNVVLVSLACAFGFFLAETVVGYDLLALAGVMFVVSVLSAIRISKRSETKWLE